MEISKRDDKIGKKEEKNCSRFSSIGEKVSVSSGAIVTKRLLLQLLSHQFLNLGKPIERNGVEHVVKMQRRCTWEL
ncbi:hypothetical protein [Williamwhitmania taraxaci]|uniref:hypothetical protein n=1 Tax=Williamwhitmania taraxaci TaxID=1640674 RepID=UPI000B808681|nr:hypothetical protein [Williamwhitmania taraxaci]